MIRHHKTRLITGVILLILCVVILIFADKKFTGPTKTNYVTSPYSLPKQPALTLIPKNYQDRFVSFNYPSIMTINQTPKFNLPTVDVATLAYPDVQGWLLAVDVLNIPSGNFYNNSAYQMRSIYPSIYKLSQTTINGVSVPIFTDTTATGYKRVAFLISGNYQATVSLTGNDTSGITPLADTMAMILNSWRWQSAY